MSNEVSSFLVILLNEVSFSCYCRINFLLLYCRIKFLPFLLLLHRKFQEYVDCMYPAFMCPSLLKGFWTNYEAYKRPPYRCRPRNGTALPKHYKFTMDAPSNSGLGYTCAANHVVTITAVTILASHIQSGDV